MKFNFKVLIAVFAVVAILAWGVTSLLARSYSGESLNFGVGSGPVTVTNPSADALDVQLLSAKSGVFSVSSTNEAMTGRSERQGTGNKSTQLFAFQIPPGVSEFSVRGGSEVNFVALSNAILTANVQPSSASEMRTTLIVMAVVVLGALYYISKTYDHRWLSMLRGQQPVLAPVPVPVVDSNGGQGPTMRTYGDNRSKP